MELTERKLKILQQIIGDYVRTAEPVGSRTLSKEFNNAFSPATIRNEMSDLEEMGYLTHPHTSAGRVPSDKAYRWYVNNLMGKVEIPQESQKMIKDTLHSDIDELDKTIQRAADLLSEITNLAAFALSPVQDEDRLKFVDFLPVDEHTVILMTVAESGKSSNTLIHLEQPVSDEVLRVLSKTLTYTYRGRQLTDFLKDNIVSEFQDDVAAMSPLARDVMPNFMHTLENLLNVRFYMDGLSNIFDQPEYTDLKRAKNFISLFDKRDELVKTLMDRDNGMVVTIGDENTDEELKDCSLITATYHVNGRFAGKIGVIGPTRMKYDEITSIVQYLTDNLNDAFKIDDGGGEDKNDE